MGEGDLKELRELVEFLKGNGVAEFDMERPELKVRLKFASAAEAAAPASAPLDLASLARLLNAGTGALTAPMGAQTPHLETGPAASGGVVAAAVPAPVEVDEEAGLHIVKSPLVGTFYDAASPGADPFIKLGDTVATGGVMCIVEAMKIMNEIESDAAGQVMKIYAKAGQPVEYGQRLFGIKI